jgi:hypothetical protein
MHDCRQASEATKPILFLSGRLQRAVFFRRRRWTYLDRSKSILKAWELPDKLNGVIKVSRLKDLNAAELFLGFRIGAAGRCDFAVFPVQVNALSGG